jgi:hypothetical protein
MEEVYNMEHLNNLGEGKKESEFYEEGVARFQKVLSDPYLKTSVLNLYNMPDYIFHYFFVNIEGKVINTYTIDTSVDASVDPRVTGVIENEINGLIKAFGDANSTKRVFFRFFKKNEENAGKLASLTGDLETQLSSKDVNFPDKPIRIPVSRGGLGGRYHKKIKNKTKKSRKSKRKSRRRRIKI